MPSPEYLRQRLRYDPDTGKLFWREHPDMPKQWNTRYAGKEAFTAITHGHRYGAINDKTFYAHRVIWAMIHGEWPPEQIDHRNHIRTDNRLTNLRLASNTDNAKNTVIPKNNTSGAVGVHWYKSRNRWTAHITVNRRTHNLGYFDTFEEALAARKTAEVRFGFHENHGVHI